MSQRLLLLLFLFVYKSSSSSSVKLRIHQNGLNYFTGTAKEILEHELKTMEIPEQRIEFKRGHARFFDIVLDSLEVPNYSVAFENGALVLTTSGGFVNGRFRYEAQKKIVIKLRAKGNVDVHASNVVSRIVLNLNQNADKPHLTVAGCEARVDDVSLKFHGNIVQKIINLFKNKIASMLKDKISEMICPQITKLVESRVNTILARVPSLFPVTKEGQRIFSVEYNNLQSAVGNGFMDISANAVFHFNGKQCVATTQDSYPDGPATHMFSTWYSQGVPNCILQAFHESNQLQYSITSQMEKAAKYLSTSCPSNGVVPQCIGSLFPKLATDYPNRHVDLLAYSTSPPTVFVTAVGIRAVAHATLNVNLDQQTLAQFQLNLTAAFVPKFQGNHFFGTINVESAHVSLASSEIGEVDPNILGLAGSALPFGANYVLQPIAEKGMVFPVLHQWKIGDSSSISLLDGYLRSDVDIATIV